jgi:hypothetical protein
MNELGFDCSGLDTRPDQPINWLVAHEHGIRYATIRATSGAQADYQYKPNMEGARAAGIHVMPYTYLVFHDDPVKQAVGFLNAVEWADLPPMLDLEEYERKNKAFGGCWKAAIKPWLDYVGGALGITPVIYSSPGFIRQFLSADTEAVKYPLVIAHYDINAPYVGKPWIPGRELAWQFGDGRDGYYYGFTGARGCALYAWNGELADYVKEWSGGSFTPPPPPPERQARVITSSLNIRSWPSGDATPDGTIGVVKRNQVVTVYDERKDYYGNTWARIGEDMWSALRYGSSVYLEYL